MVESRKTPFKKPQEVPELVKNLDDIFRELQKDFLYGVELKDVQLTTTPIKVSHKLGRNPVGWIVTRKNANGDVWENNQADGRFLNLVSDNSITVTIWVW